MTVLLATVISLEDPKRGQKVWALPVRGRVSVGYVLGNAATDYQRLGYGHGRAWHGLGCTSARRGLTCRNLAGHGFFLSRSSQHVF